MNRAVVLLVPPPSEPRRASTRRILLVPGSLRGRSTTAAVLLTATRVAPPGVATIYFQGGDELPHFNPDDDQSPLHPAVESLRAHIHAADAVLFSTPEYAGALPGSFKNLLDWTIGDPSPGSVYEKLVGWINASPRGATHAYDELRRVMTYAGATIVDAACADIPVTPGMIDDGGLVADGAVVDRIARVLRSLVPAPDSGSAAEDDQLPRDPA